MKKMLRLGFLIPLFALSLVLGGCGDDGNKSTAPDAFMGGLVWDNWTKVDAGGTGELPTGADTNGFLRCKACHGWDAKGLEGGYVRRSANADRPNPEPGVNLTAADATLTLVAVNNSDGRAFSVKNQQMPAFDTIDGLTDQQAEDVLEFLLTGPKIGDFANIDTTANPVAYTFIDVDTDTGRDLYAKECLGCHGAATATTQTASGPELGTYYVKDGKYSEGFHKTVYGIPGTSMTRAAMGALSGQEVADIHAYIQSRLELPGDAFVGGLAWDNWTKVDAGGTGELPTGAGTNGFLRCKACHGWDAKGLEGGYVRRTANDTRPNPTEGVDLTAADILLRVDLDAIDNTTGRAFSVENQQMPAFNTADGLTDVQVDNLLKFLVSGPKIGDYATIDTTSDPVAYTFNNADTGNGGDLYASQCLGCHGAADATTQTASGPELGTYYVKDGKYSEGFHKTVYGIPDTSMTRTAMGDLSGQEVADIHAYIQLALGSDLSPTPTPVIDGAALFNSCSGCHGANGTNVSGTDLRTLSAVQLQSAHNNNWTQDEAQAVADHLNTQ